MALENNYNFKDQEPKLQDFWNKNLVYKFNPKTTKEIFSIDTPPPTVSGKMHIGHAFSYSQQDFIARFQRMQGKEVFYPFGTDDNGLATERLIEKMKNVKGSRMDRQEFINLCLTTLEEIRPDFVSDWKKIAISCDYSIFYSTIDNHCRKISQKSFLDLHKVNRVYQKEAPTIWCPNCQTAIAQVELEDKELDSHFNDIIFKTENHQDLIIATTRPEMLGSCVALFANPTDERYKSLFGKKAKVPLFNHFVPILADERAKQDKGTGIVMCCTFGDQTDIEWYKAYNLPLKMSISADGHMNDLAGSYVGLKIKDARKQIIEDLEHHKLLIKKTQIKHAVNTHERCGTEIEILNTKQWFVNYLDLKEEFIERGKQINWHPQFMRVRLDNWIHGLQWDWCISRQRFSGVPIPVWYCKSCNAVTLADESQLPVDPLKAHPKQHCSCGSNEFVPEKDILDTWATSSLTPQLAVQLFDKQLQQKLFPMSLRPQSHDIITFWLFNTLVKTHLHHNTIPWRNVMISGHALDAHGRKMSKSLGNIVEPQKVIEKYGADCLRYWAAGSKLGDDLPYQEKDLVTGQKMITKLWNVAKFCSIHLHDYNGAFPEKFELIDQWLLYKLSLIIKEGTESFQNYEYSRTKIIIDDFFWYTFCDYYLEIIKDRVYNPDRRGHAARISAQFTLDYTLDVLIKLLAPIMPHITEAIYQTMFIQHEKSTSIHLTQWPDVKEQFLTEEFRKAGFIGDDIAAIIGVVRKHKSATNVSLKTELKSLVIDCTSEERKNLELALDDLKATVISREIDFNSAKGECTEKIKVDVVF
ncbi:valine--tRNA ligase [Candidatus Woesearchaeota archaeon]|nr:valine--tRNA ligase [Candidatus Woesearchaeota archaeon]